MASSPKLNARYVPRYVLRIQKWDFYCDNGYWAMMLQWLKMFIPQWESRFKQVTKELVELPDPARLALIMGEALGIEPGVLLYYAENGEMIDAFLENNRAMLGRIAELKLWDLVNKGDAATIRWLLPRLKNKDFGDKLVEVPGDTPTSINIIEVTGNIK